MSLETQGVRDICNFQQDRKCLVVYIMKVYAIFNKNLYWRLIVNKGKLNGNEIM